MAVISNGTAILGLGNLGALASKPVMEGKAVLFKRFADVDAIDLEVVIRGPRRDHHLRQDPRPHLRRHQPRGHQGAGVLHHRERLQELLDIPVFHDDQHGTAIISAAGLINALQLTGRDIDDQSWSATAPAPPASPPSS